VSASIAVIDYGMGNLRSVQKALEAVGARARVTDSAAEVREAQAVVLPGVGAFGEAVRRLQKQKLWGAIEDTLTTQKPFLGICLGLQLLFESSEESPRVKGLGYLKGPVVRFKSRRKSPLKVPHIGWNSVELNRKNRSPWMKGLRPGEFFYFVHSFFPAPNDRNVIAATTPYGEDFCSAAAGESYFATQFHPEKSGDQGLRLLKAFVKRAKEQ
jgi:glutamine amidotransferase